MPAPVCHRPSPRSSRVQTAPANRLKQQRPSLTKKPSLLPLRDLANEGNPLACEQRRDAFAKIAFIGTIDLGRDQERHADSASDLDGPIDPLFRRNTAKESEIVARRAE